MICSLDASYIQQMDARDRICYLPVIFRHDNDDPKTKAKIIRIANARQHQSPSAALKASKKALRKLWRNLMNEGGIK